MAHSEVRLIGPAGLPDADISEISSLVGSLVAGGAALGWVTPPSSSEVAALLGDVIAGIATGDAALAVAFEPAGPVGFGYWQRYARPTHRVNADIEKVAINPKFQGKGLGRTIMSALIEAAVTASIETLTLDVRGDNLRAAALYESLGFRRYGTLDRFVAFGPARYDKLLYALDLRAITVPDSSRYRS
ncbi:GNAT family N-acetyltransferase [Actinoplanes sp. L3-i22]|uniref:GNAT family N-acetyltransferase n=1 Tax=Actinoplanes sp. L3-i22 TaxID=2836373 RepID=UPI001C8414B4|nr:GNAT family N-acetyltransferase [Actinoplanes sp. L3-i22]